MYLKMGKKRKHIVIQSFIKLKLFVKKQAILTTTFGFVYSFQ